MCKDRPVNRHGNRVHARAWYCDACEINESIQIGVKRTGLTVDVNGHRIQIQAVTFGQVNTAGSCTTSTCSNGDKSGTRRDIDPCRIARIWRSDIRDKGIRVDQSGKHGDDGCHALASGRRMGINRPRNSY